MNLKFQNFKIVRLSAIPIVFMLIFIAGCNECPKCPEQPTGTADSVSEDTSNYVDLKGLNNSFSILAETAHPLPEADVVELREARPLYLKHRNHPSPTLAFATSTIKLNEFIKYANRTADMRSIRFYPAFNDGNQLQVIMTRSDGDASSAAASDFDYTLLRRDYSMGGFPESLNQTTARNYVTAFFTNVNINNAPPDPSTHYYQKSRLYLWREIVQFLSGNIAAFDSTKPDQYSKYKIVMEIGYTDLTSSRIFYSKLDPKPTNYGEDELQGFTVMMYLIDPAGTPMLNNTDYGTYSYYRKALEVAHVCPPVCGDLY